VNDGSWAIATCSPSLIEADPDYETFSYFPYLLAWDLERLPRRRGRRPVACVFMDTFEALTDHVDRQAESFLQRCIYLMPNVLFVVTGRNRLDWADRPAGSGLDFTGEARWPNLHFSNDTREPRQHLVGYLSDSDADSYLSAALTKDGHPVIPVAIRQKVIAGAQGLPLYLDLSVSHFVEMLARGDEPMLDDFGGSFVAVATRTIRDLPQEERDLVRTASLVDRFDAGLLRAGQPASSDGRVARFLQRSFLMQDDAYELPYTLHHALRMAIGDADATMPDGWSDLDRQQVAQRLLSYLGQRVTDDADRFTITQALETGLKLANAQSVFEPWLVDATERLVEAGEWSTVGGWLPADEPATPELQAINAAIKGVVLRREGDPRGSVAVLDGAVTGLPSDSEHGRLVRVHLAHALRNTGDYTRAAGIYNELLDSDFDHVARYWLCDHDYLNGRFRTALSQLESWEGRNAADEGERLRLVGHIARVNARFDDAVMTYIRAIDLADAEGLAAAEAKALVNLAQTRCWTGVGAAAIGEIATRARDLLDLVPNPVELVKLRSTEAVAAAIASDHDGARTAVDDTRRLAEEIGYTGGHNLADVAAILLAVRSGDAPAAASQALADLGRRTAGSGGNIYWVPIAAAWIGQGDEYDHRWRDIEWLDGEDTLRRWAEVATA
jgi:tetratricopeptide (TPR) repeat protein